VLKYYISGGVADVTSQTLEHKDVVLKAEVLSKSIVSSLLNDPQMSGHTMVFLQDLFSREATQSATASLFIQVLARESSRAQVASLVRGVIQDLATDQSTNDTLAELMMSLFQRDDMHQVFVAAVSRMAQDPATKAQVAVLLSDAVASEPVQVSSTQLAYDVSQSMLENEGVRNHTTEFFKSTLQDESLQQTGSNAVWSIVKHTVLPGFMTRRRRTSEPTATSTATTPTANDAKTADSASFSADAAGATATKAEAASTVAAAAKGDAVDDADATKRATMGSVESSAPEVTVDQHEDSSSTDTKKVASDANDCSGTSSEYLDTLSTSCSSAPRSATPASNPEPSTEAETLVSEESEVHAFGAAAGADAFVAAAADKSPDNAPTIDSYSCSNSPAVDQDASSAGDAVNGEGESSRDNGAESGGDESGGIDHEHACSGSSNSNSLDGTGNGGSGNDSDNSDGNGGSSSGASGGSNSNSSNRDDITVAAATTTNVDIVETAANTKMPAGADRSTSIRSNGGPGVFDLPLDGPFDTQETACTTPTASKSVTLRINATDEHGSVTSLSLSPASPVSSSVFATEEPSKEREGKRWTLPTAEEAIKRPGIGPNF
jgi:uncharacterized membrane protein YgcG